MDESKYAGERLPQYDLASRSSTSTGLLQPGEYSIGRASDTEKDDSLKYYLTDRWLEDNLIEVRNARLRLKTAYQDYLTFCNKNDCPAITIQGFSQLLFLLQDSRWPSSARKRTSKGWLLINLTLSRWVSEEAQEGGKAALACRP